MKTDETNLKEKFLLSEYTDITMYPFIRLPVRIPFNNRLAPK
jgi:hypothetical protein